MRRLLSAVAFALAAVPAWAAAPATATASDSFQAALAPAAPAQPALYSFADIYRLSVAGVPLSSFSNPGDVPIRVAASQAAPTPELQFSVVSIAGPQRWALVLAGLAAALWVARRRMGYPL
jgi:hypothetical protein